MRLFSTVIAVAAILSLVPCMSAQAVIYTGDVQADFPQSNIFPDPGGQDIVMPGPLAGTPCGWDIKSIAVAYDAVTDFFHVGIETYGIAGDADGDGSPDTTGPDLAAMGGQDQVDFASGECFVFGLDLDNDGTIDFVAGIPDGLDATAFTVAHFTGTITNPGAGFGLPMPSNTGQLNRQGNDLEFTIERFSHLAFNYFHQGQTDFGMFAFMGSADDATIGNDAHPDSGIMQQPIIILPCAPVDNQLSPLGIEFQPTGIELTLRYGVRANYGCCILVSLYENVAGEPITQLPGMPVINVGLPQWLEILAWDLGVPPATGNAVDCKDMGILFPFGLIPSGTTLYFQYVGYPAMGLGFGDYLASNTASFTHP